MRTTFFLLIFTLMAIPGAGQDLPVTFFPVNDSILIDSITATNQSTGESITFPGGATLWLSSGSGIANTSSANLDGSVFPNPSEGRSTLRWYRPASGNLSLTVLDLCGRTVATHTCHAVPGDNLFTISLPSPGIYMLCLEEGETHSVIKLISNGSFSRGEAAILGGKAASGMQESGAAAPSGLRQLKSTFLDYQLGYSAGESLLFQCTAGNMSTVITDSPEQTKNYSVEFWPCTDPDGQNYPSVKIGNQTWMARNLAYLKEIGLGGDSLPASSVYGYWGFDVAEAKANPNYKSYGVLYNWPAAMDGWQDSIPLRRRVRGICPEGWHLPDADEITQLIHYLGPDAGIQLRSIDGWKKVSRGQNTSGFGALPAGERWMGGFTGLGKEASFWSSTVFPDHVVMSYMLLLEDGWEIAQADYWRTYHSVRCMKD